NSLFAVEPLLDFTGNHENDFLLLRMSVEAVSMAADDDRFSRGELLRPGGRWMAHPTHRAPGRRLGFDIACDSPVIDHRFPPFAETAARRQVGCPLMDPAGSPSRQPCTTEARVYDFQVIRVIVTRV